MSNNESKVPAHTNEELVQEIRRLHRVIDAVDDALFRNQPMIAKYHTEEELKRMSEPNAIGTI